MSIQQKAEALAMLGMYVFPVSVEPDPGNPAKLKKTPLTARGFYDASLDPSEFSWTHPSVQVGVWCGPSGLCVLDIDVKRDAEGNIVVDGYTSLDEAWLDVPGTFQYTTVGGEGTHLIYSLENSQGINGKTNYRKMSGVDRRAGNSYLVWAGDVPESRSDFSPAPTWLLDATELRSKAEFTGNLQDWYDTLEPGEPNGIVRKAIDRAKTAFAMSGDDFSHSDIVERQHEAVRLGAEGHPGVPQLLEVLEDLTLSRTGEHSRPESEWAHEFAEALESGIRKYGDTIALRKNLPAYSPSLIPVEVSDSLVTGRSGDKQDFNALLSAMARYETNDLNIVSVLWNAPKTRDVSREWGLDFVLKRVQASRTSLPPERENPTLPDIDAPVYEMTDTSLLTEDEIEYVLDHPTFIDEYIDASYRMKGWVNRDYAIPAAWTLLSMAFGFRAFIPKSKGIPLNLWFITLGYSGTGKSVSLSELSHCLDLLLKQPEETYYNLGANSSVEAMHEALLDRDKKPSMVLHDEASDFFEGLQRKDWMSGLKDNFAKWYDGFVPPVQKVRLKELKGKSALTSFNINMLATPDRLVSKIDDSMFESGFLARVNWSWGEKPDENSMAKYQVQRTEYTEDGIPPLCYDLVASLLMAQRSHGTTKTAVDWTDDAASILTRTYIRMDEIAKARDHYDTTEPAITRLGAETIWKCAALLALYRGDRVIQPIDALTAVYYAQRWFDDLFRVVDEAGHGEFSHRMDDIEAYIRKSPHGVTEAKIFDRFKGFARFSRKDVDNIIEYLLASGRILWDAEKRKYRVNGG